MPGVTNLLAAPLSPLAPAGQGQTDEAAKKSDRLEQAAKGFETLMITQMMKSVRENSGGGWLSEGDEAGEDTSTGMAEEQLAKAMTDGGGLGLTKMVMKTMSRVDKGGAAAQMALSPRF